MQLHDIDIRFFKEDLVRFINTNPLPLEIKRLVLSEVTSMVTEAANDVIQIQRQAKEQPKPSTLEETNEDESKEAEEWLLLNIMEGCYE